MRIRGATTRDFTTIDDLLKDQGTALDFPHLKQIVVVVDGDDEVIGVGSLVTILEASILIDKGLSKKERVAILQMIIDQSNIETKNLGYERFYAFVQSGSLVRLLKRKFSFIYATGVNMLRWV